MNRIKELRDERGWKQEYLGKKLNVMTSTVSKYERETISISSDTIIKLSEIFGVTTDYILYLTPNRHTMEADKNVGMNEDEQTLLSIYKALNKNNKLLIRSTIINLYRKQKT